MKFATFFLTSHRLLMSGRDVTQLGLQDLRSSLTVIPQVIHDVWEPTLNSYKLYLTLSILW